jgi:hypothetical protein
MLTSESNVSENLQLEMDVELSDSRVLSSPESKKMIPPSTIINIHNPKDEKVFPVTIMDNDEAPVRLITAPSCFMLGSVT